MKSKIIIAFIFLFFLTYSNTKSEITENYLQNKINSEVIIRLTNGDLLTCEIKDYDAVGDSLISISVKTKIGSTKIYLSEISEITTIAELNRNSHRIFILPTAEPIGRNTFIGNFELLFFYAGVGITDYVSITAGRSIIPGEPGDYQITNLNGKITFYRQYWESMSGSMSVAAGVNYAMLNSFNKITHLYSSLSFVTEKSVFTGSVYAKIGDKDYYEFNLRQDLYPFTFENGAFGIALGVDTRFSNWKNIHVIGELWNANITKPSNTGVMLGFRIGNTKLSADFGLALFTTPFVLPFTSFVWTPF